MTDALPPPRLDTREGRLAFRQELDAVAPRLTMAGIYLIAAGAAVVLLLLVLLPGLAAMGLWLGYGLILTGAGLSAAAMRKRHLYKRSREAGR